MSKGKTVITWLELDNVWWLCLNDPSDNNQDMWAKMIDITRTEGEDQAARDGVQGILPGVMNESVMHV